MLTAKQKRLNVDVVSVRIFLRDSKEVIRKHAKSLLPRGHKKKSLPGVVEDNNEEMDVEYDIFLVKF